MKSSEVLNAAMRIANALNGPASSGDAWTDGVVRDLQSARGKSLVVVGPHQPPDVHLLAYTMNAALGNVGQTVEYIEPVEPVPLEQLESLKQLTKDMQEGRVDLLLVVGGNPVYTAPADLEFAKQFATVRMRIHLSLMKMRLRICVSGISRRLITSNHGAISARTMERPQSCSL
jgi:molybdopterin-containing oxidoreductase family iron-sulfur binding subunit